MHRIFLMVLSLLCSITMLKAQTLYSVSGKIIDSEGAPITGANVFIKNTTIGTISNANGIYILNNLKRGTYTIEYTFIGYDNVEHVIDVQNTDVTYDVQLSEASTMLEGLVVTAQKREELNKDVPIALTSYGTEFINNINVSQYDGLSEYVPGLQVQLQSANNPGIVIRGITSDNGDSRVEPRVSVFQDGVSISKSRGSVVELFDIERVEILKGPQGTLFGRGAQIGAMHIIQNKPKNNTEGEIKLGYGNYNQKQVTGFFNTPIVKDKLLFRLAGTYNAYDGFIDNISGGKLNGKETGALRASMKYLISDKTRFTVIANWQQDTPPGTAFKSGTYAPIGGDVKPWTAADLEQGENLGLDRTVWGVTGILKHQFNNVWDLTSTTAYRAFDSDEAFDGDGTAAPSLYFHEIAEGKQFSQEVRLNFDKGGKFRGFTGANFFFEDGSQKVPLYTNEQSLVVLMADYLLGTNYLVADGVPAFWPAIPPAPGIPDELVGVPLQEYNEEYYANYGKNYSGDIFLDFSYDFTSKLTATLGLRGTWENITAGYEAGQAKYPAYLGYLTGTYPNNISKPTDGRITKNDHFLSMVGRFALNYDISKNVTLFGNVARGRRPNVISINADETRVLNDEIVWSYEVGAKSLFFNKHLLFDVNAYIYDYSHFQTSVATFDTDGGINLLTDDSGNATAKGFEVATQYSINRNLSVFANYAYIDATFDDTDDDGNDQAYAGNTFRLTPKNSYSAGINAMADLIADMEAYFRPSYSYKSGVYFEEDNDPTCYQEGYGLLNFKVGLKYKKRADLSFYMNNALDEEYVIDAGNTGKTFGIPTYIAGPPRFYGTQLVVKF
nr:TonB-dependent receptor [uncultured Carboxylicivirga sp.]